MAFKINISEKSGKTYKVELETEELIGKELHSKISGKELLPDLEGYEFELTGASDKSGFTVHDDVSGIGLKRVLLTYGKAMKKRPRREGKKKVSNAKPKGFRLRKTVRGKVISPEIVQINLKILKEGSKKLSEIFPEQNKPKEEVKEEPAKPDEVKEEIKKEVKPVEKPKEELKKEKSKEEAKKESKAETASG
ncbi:MAG: S6e family ribosomal protein [Nanoarchaeota archaeon]